MKNIFSFLSIIMFAFAFGQRPTPNPTINGGTVDPSPTTVGGATSVGFNLRNASSVAVPYNAFAPMQLKIDGNKWKPVFEADGVTPIVHSANNNHIYFTWTAQCTSNCGDSDESDDIWTVFGRQNQTFPGTITSPPFTGPNGYIWIDGIALAPATIAEANANNGVGFIANLTPRPGFDNNVNDNQAANYTHTLEPPCTADPAAGTPAITYVGISTLDRENQNWLTASEGENQLGAYVALESTNKAFIVTRIASPETAIATPVVGMVVWDTDDYCLKLYKADADGNGNAGWSCTSNLCD